MPHDLTLVLGGARSGKSSFAEAEVTAQPGPWYYMATAQAFDDEMRERIAQHRADRAEGWITQDVPLTLATALCDVPPQRPVLVDCLTLWLSNHLLAESVLGQETAALQDALAARRGPVWLVANEVGLGIVPDNALARRFRDEAGRLNQRLAKQADRVRFIAAGLPLALKG